MEPAADVVGRTLGEFTLREKIGQGAFGAVFRAVQTSLGREAVVKILQPKSGAAGGTAKVRFLREARLASRLDHPYAAHIYAFGAEDDGTLWIAMELVRGTSLADLLRGQGAIPVDRAIPLLERICEVVENAHEHGIVHRDLKPANIMIITRGGRLFPKLLDLGLAKIVDAPEEAAAPKTPGPTDLKKAVGVAETMREADDGHVAVTQRGAYIGTPLYMAPEQWTQGTIDARADQYALGCVAYECLVGKPPFVGRSVIEVARAHQSAALPALPAGVPGKMADVLARAVAKKAPDRWDSVLRFATALREAAGLGGESPLPEVDEALRRVAQDAPAPIAEAAAGIEAARNPHEARDAVLRTVRVTLRWLAIIGLAGRTRGGVESASAGQMVAELLRELRKRELDERDWVELIAALVKPYTDRPELHAIPEFVRAAVAGIPARLARVGEEILPTREALARAYVELSVALREMTFLRDYPVVVPRGSNAEIWMGARRASRPSVELAAAVPEGEGRPVLADADRRPVLVLWPLAQLAAPSPGAPEELFLLEGYGRRGARLVGGAVGFERQDEGVWDYFRQSILDESLADSGPRLEVAPYRGLAPFTAEDARMFYGREREAEAFANRLKVQSLLVVAGPSGVGKSSFVQAGVAPSLPEGSQVVVVRPGSTPLATLSARLGTTEPAMLVVDQFEELITLCADPAEREAYAARLVALSRGATRVVLTVRDDFLARIAELPSLRDRVTQGLHLLTTPAKDDLLRILLEPARRAGYEFDPRELPDKMMAEVTGRPGALALLSFTASKLWDARDRHFRRLTGAAYDAMGGVGGALARHADETLAHVPAAEQRLVREAFRHLVTSEGTRAVLTPSELRQLLGGGAAAERVIETLINARLLVSDEERVEIIHEALVVAWPRLVEWRREDIEGSRFRDQLRTAVKAWDERGRPEGLLWRGDALADFQRWRAGYQGALTQAEEVFTTASLDDARRSRRNRTVLIASALALLSVAVVVLIVLNQRAKTSEALARTSETEAKRSATESRDRLLDSYEEQGRQYFLAGDELRGMPFLLEAWKEGRRGIALRHLLARGSEAVSLQAAVWPHDADVWVARLSPDQTRVASASLDGRVRVWDMSTGRRLLDLEAHKTLALTVAFSPDGRLLATGGGDNRVRLWDLATGKMLAELAHEGRVYGVAFSSDGVYLASASWDQNARVWKVPDATPIATLHEETKFETVAFLAGDERLLVTGHDGHVRIWDWRAGRLSQDLAGPEGRVRGHRLSDDGARLLVTREIASPTVWSLPDGKLLAKLEHPADVLDADLSGDGRLVVTGAQDAVLRIWDAQSGQMLLNRKTSAPVKRVRFCGEDKVAAGGDDGVITLWRPSVGAPLGRLVGHLDVVSSLDCDASGRRLVSGGWDERVRVWDLTRDHRRSERGIEITDALVAFDVRPDGRRWITSYGERASWIWDAGRFWPTLGLATSGDLTIWTALSPDGDRVATVSAKPPAVRLWSILGPTTPVSFEGLQADPWRAEFSPDGRRLATTDAQGRVLFWDTATGRKLSTIDAHKSRASVAFSPDGKRIATAGNDQTIGVWDATTGAPVHRLTGHTSLVQSVVFDETGDQLVSASSDRTLRVWDVTSGRSIQVLEGNTGEMTSAVFQDGLIISGSRDGELRVWDRASGKLLERLPIFDRVWKVNPMNGQIATGGPNGLLVWAMAPVPINWSQSLVEDCRLPYLLVDGTLHKKAVNLCEERWLY